MGMFSVCMGEANIRSLIQFLLHLFAQCLLSARHCPRAWGSTHGPDPRQQLEQG